MRRERGAVSTASPESSTKLLTVKNEDGASMPAKCGSNSKKTRSVFFSLSKFAATTRTLLPGRIQCRVCSYHKPLVVSGLEMCVMTRFKPLDVLVTFIEKKLALITLTVKATPSQSKERDPSALKDARPETRTRGSVAGMNTEFKLKDALAANTALARRRAIANITLDCIMV